VVRNGSPDFVASDTELGHLSLARFERRVSTRHHPPEVVVRIGV